MSTLFFRYLHIYNSSKDDFLYFSQAGRLVKVRKAKVSCVCSLQEFLDFLSSFVEFNRSPYAFLPRFWTYNVVFLLLWWVPISLARCVSIFFINYYFTFNDILLAIWIYYFNTLLINITKQFIKFTKWTSESRYFLKLIFESSLFLSLIKHCVTKEWKHRNRDFRIYFSLMVFLVFSAFLSNTDFATVPVSN